MRSGAHEGLMCPLEGGVVGLIQVIRCRAGVGEQWQPCGDGKPAGPDRPLERGMGGGLKRARGASGFGTESQ